MNNLAENNESFLLKSKQSSPLRNCNLKLDAWSSRLPYKQISTDHLPLPCLQAVLGLRRGFQGPSAGPPYQKRPTVPEPRNNNNCEFNPNTTYLPTSILDTAYTPSTASSPSTEYPRIPSQTAPAYLSVGLAAEPPL